MKIYRCKLCGERFDSETYARLGLDLFGAWHDVVDMGGHLTMCGPVEMMTFGELLEAEAKDAEQRKEYPY